MSGRPTRRVELVLVALVGVLVAVVGMVGGAVPGPSPTVASPSARVAERPSRVMIVAVPRLVWEDVAEAVTPQIEAFLADSAHALLSVRAIGPLTSRAEAYVTMGAGNRATVPARSDLTPQPTDDGGLFSPAVRPAIVDADRKLYGAQPGAFGDALHAAGLRTGLVAPDGASLLLLADSAGLVDAGLVEAGPVDERATAAAMAADVVLVELSDLEALEPDGPFGAYLDGSPPTEADRRAALATVDERFGALVGPATADTLVVLVSPAAPGDRGQLTVAAWRGPGVVPGLARSATTRRDGYVTLPDVAPTLLDALGLDVPDAMNGTLVTGGHGPRFDAARADWLAARSERALYRDRTVGPLSVVYIVVQVLVYGAAAFGIARDRPRLRRIAVAGALVVLAVPTCAFLSGLVPYRRLPLALYVVAVVLAAAVLAAVATVRSASARRGAYVLVAVAWAVQVVDIVLGGALQLDTPFGYSPIVAGRFQGFGNLAFSLLGAAALVTMTGTASAFARVTARGAVTVAAVVGFVTLVVDGAPMFGADVGGVLALLPAVCVAGLVLTGRRAGWRRLGALGVAAGVVLAGFAAIDFARPESDRTHLARFVTRVFDGDGTLIVRRKVAANLHILTSSVWTWLLPVVFGLVYVLARRADGPLARLRANDRGIDACVRSAVVLGGLGFAVNDSGIAIPAMMCGVIMPWLVVRAVEQAGSDGQGAP